MRDPRPLRFHDRRSQGSHVAFGAVLALLGLALRSSRASRRAGAVLTAGGTLVGVRAMRASSLAIDDQEVTTRTLVRTRRYALSQVWGVDVAVGRTGWTSARREHLVLHLAGRHDVAFTALSSPALGHRAATSVVRLAAATIDGRVPARRPRVT